jgi:CHAT domain-containing protein/tetratricopeptide (TPR) repeat protein
MRCGRWTIAAAAFAFGVACAAATAPAVRRLVPSTRLDEHLAPAATRQFRMSLQSGQAVDLALIQFDTTLQLRWHAAGEEPSPLFQNDAGRQARLRLTVIASKAGDVILDVSAKGGGAAHYSLQTGKPHVATAQDRQRAAAQQSLAVAENLRRSAGSLEAGKSAAAVDLPARVLVSYQAAIDAALAAGDACTASMARAGLARWHFARGDYAHARSDAEAALPTHCGEEGDVSAAAEAAVAERTLGSALGYQGDLIASTATSERALARYRQTGDPNYQAMLLGNLSANYRVLGESHRALATAQAALDLAQTLGDAKRALFSRESMASIHLQRGELASALKLYRQVVEDLKTTPYPLVEGMSWNDMGLLYDRLGNAPAADAAYARAAAAWTASGDESGLAETRLNAADSLLEAGRVDEAEKAYGSALQFDREHHFQREEIHALSSLGRVALTRGAWDSARTHLQAARDLAHEIRAQSLEAGAEQGLGDLASRRGDSDAARVAYTRSAHLAEAVGDRATRASAQASVARLDAEAGQLADAQSAIEQALVVIESERAAIPDPQLRTTYFATQRAYYALYIDVLMRRHAREPDAGFAILALQAAERARARSLLDLLVTQRIDLQPKLDADLAAALRDAEDRRRELAWQRNQMPTTADAATRDGLQRDIDRSEQELDAVRGRVRAADPRYAALAQPEALSIAEVQRDLLDADSTVYEYWLDDTRSYVWRVTPLAVDAAVLPGREHIEKDITSLRERLRGPGAVVDMPIEELLARESEDNAAVLRQAQKLGEILLPKSLAGKAHQQIVVGDGKVQLLPFSLFAKDAGVMQRYVPSLASLRELQRRERAAAGNGLAVFADPVSRSDDDRLPPGSAVAPIDNASLRTLPRLRETRREANIIQDLSGDRASWLALDFAANRRAVLDADWSRYAIVHFAAHALLDLRNPELSGIVLSLYDAAGKPEDGFVRIGDLYHLRMPVDLVVLGVCDSAEGESLGAEGVFSLARAFFHAGARSVVASLWPVDDRASAVFMQAFYTALLRDHATPGHALLAAQAHLRADPRWNAPRYWAAFVLQGEGSAAGTP